MTQLTKDIIAAWFKELQTEICSSLESLDGVARFETDNWQREGGGGGKTRVIRNGKVFEKGGVNFSAVWGETPNDILRALALEKADFFATGVSIVIHPQSPKVPIIHMNVRYFEMSNGIWWFGGGIDLTPIYVVEADSRFFHQQLKQTCDAFNTSYYPRFKTWADDYFYIKHRKETRGIGGIFFDRLNEQEGSKSTLFEFVKAVGKMFVPVYSELVNRNRKASFSESEKKWQLLRRGRYVEFNLVLDKGTKFGLDTEGRTESILMSLPLLASWEYNLIPSPDSPEAQTLSWLRKGIDWTETPT